ncbi:MAG: radical SAM protein [Kiritimatiellae bacterium]|nr:radical SAM protein [Kiritimatiellia bacterium]
MKHIFGPVTSRRYGLSLGVDLSVPKTCSFNCSFCQIGPTPQTSVTRTAQPPIQDILAELHQWLKSKEPADFITAAGSGEPTLHLHFSEVLRFARNEARCRSLLLSNGSLFSLPEVRQDAALADVVKISLHAWDQHSFESISRPHPSLCFDAIIEGYRQFRLDFKGQIDLEVFIVPGINDTPDQVRKIANIAASFHPDTIMLNTAVRPPADNSVTRCPQTHLRLLAHLFTPVAQAVGDEPAASFPDLKPEVLLELVSRHPASLRFLSTGFKKPEQEIRALLDSLASSSKLRIAEHQGELWVFPQ